MGGISAGQSPPVPGQLVSALGLLNSKNKTESYCVPQIDGHSVESGIGQMLPVFSEIPSTVTFSDHYRLQTSDMDWAGWKHREKGGRKGGRRER